MKHSISLIILLLIMNACTPVTPKPQQKKDLATLSDIHLSVDNNGSVMLEKKYTLKKQTKKGKLKEESAYERVPLFDKGYKKELSLKNKRQKKFSIKGNKVKISVESIPLNEFVDLVFGSVLKLNYVVSEDVKKMKSPVTLNMQTPQNSSQVFEVVKQILKMNGVSVKHKEGIFFIQKSQTNQALSDIQDVYIGYGRSLPKTVPDDKEVVQFVPYYYVNGGNVGNMLNLVGLKNVKKYYVLKKIQILKAKASEVRKALKLVNLLDRPFLQGKIPYIVNFENIEVEKFLSNIKNILALNSIKVTNNPATGGIVLLPIKELNALYVITPKKEWLDMILYWKKKLDVQTEVKQEPRLYIYHVKNRKAEELASAISKVLGLSKKSTKKNSISKKESTEKLKKTQKKQTQGVLNNFFISRADYTPTVTADKDTNILMLKLAPSHYRILLPFIQELDKLPLQTLVEVTVAEVTMTDTFSLGFEYAITNQSKNLPKSLLNITGGGSGLGVVFSGNYLDATVNAFAEKQLLNILSRPKILILNNSTGSINVGTQVPIITSETSASDITTGTTPTINRNISYRNTGINLGLTPTINSNGILTMNISINLSEAQLNDTSGIDSPLIVNRTLDTVAVVKSGDTILIGGLISTNKSKSKGGVPLLKDIPYIGNLFANQSYKTTKTELIMLIRPIIIKTSKEINAQTYKFKKLMQFLDTAQL
ncbi:hypothetical protein LCX93_01380 [Sulfurimonas sp. SWIR-19]|uniref:hypothetical protein n=1 Tax=Sulfurimonas sp. SWIR-19 TaxID=2878390 RepID=UPI001CF39E7E|nr:hypothetical protein [Sulfurimonas sp. SWIR-19]UCN00595.1 hypothetical protein LCX93_01380 [Sulfurimonas sp. SWIR-19]